MCVCVEGGGGEESSDQFLWRSRASSLAPTSNVMPDRSGGVFIWYKNTGSVDVSIFSHFTVESLFDSSIFLSHFLLF